MNMPIYIYGLVDPRTSGVRYIGNTKDVKTRLLDHVGQARTKNGIKNKKGQWIRELMSLNLKPQLRILLEATESSRWDLEEKMISHYRQFNSLVNGTDGGKGAKGSKVPFSKMSDSEKAQVRITYGKIAEANRKNGTYERSRKRMKGPGNPGKKQMKPVVQVSLDGIIVREWASIKDASIAMNCRRSGISRCCNKIPSYKTMKGFIWRYKSEINKIK